MTHQFKVGDRVRVVEDWPLGANLHAGEIVTVSRLREDGRYVVDSDADGSGWFVGPENLEAIDAKAVSPASDLLREAAEIVAGSRNATHGPKERSFTVIANFWESYISGRKEGRDAPITAVDVAWMMALLKIARSIQGDFVKDHAVDCSGYSAIAYEIAEQERTTA